MADNLVKLLFEIAGDTTKGQKATQDLRATFGLEMGQIGKILNTTFSQIESKAAYSYGYLGLGARGLARGILSATQEVSKGLGQTGRDTQVLQKEFDGLSKKTGFSISELRVLARAFNALGDDTKKVQLALAAFGNDGLKLIPQMENLGATLAGLSAQEGAAAAGAGGLSSSLIGAAGVIGIVVVVVGALVIGVYQLEKALLQATERAAAYGDEIYRGSQRTKLSTETLSGLKLAADENSVSFGTLTTGLSRYLRNVEDAHKKNKALREEFKALGIDLEKSASDPVEAINELILALNRIGDGAEENEAVIKLLGRAGDQLIPVFRQLGGDIDQTTGKARALGTALSADDARAFHIIQVAVRDLQAMMLGLSVTIGRELGPAFLGLVKAATDLLGSLKPVFELIGAVSIPLIQSLTGFMEALALAIASVTRNYEELARVAKAYAEQSNIPAIANVPAPTPVPLPDTTDDLLKEKLKAVQLVGETVRREEAATTADLKLALDQRGIAFETYVDGIKIAAKVAYDAEKTAIDDALDALRSAKQKEGETWEQYTDRVSLEQERLTSRLRAIEADRDRKLADADASLQREQLERAIAGRERSLNEQILADKKSIDAIKERVRTGEILEADAQAQLERIDRAALERRKAFLDEELIYAGANLAEQEKIKGQLKQLEIEFDNFNKRLGADRRAAKERDIAQQAALDRQDIEQRRADVNAFVSSQRDQAERGIKTFQDAEREIFKRQLDLINFQIGVLQRQVDAYVEIGNKKTADQLRGQLELLKNQRDNFIKESEKVLGFPAGTGLGEGRTGTAELSDIARNQQRAEALEEIYARIAEITRAGESAVTETMRRNATDRETIIRRELAVQIQELESRYKRERAALLRRLEILSVDAQARRKNADEIKAINDLIKALDQQYFDDLTKLAGDTKELLETLKPTSVTSIFGTSFAAALARIRREAHEAGKEIGTLTAYIRTLGEVMTSHIQSVIAQLPTVIGLMNNFIDDSIAGLSQMIQNWVIYGQTGPAAIRRVLAEALAALAADAAAKSLYYFAQGIVDIFFFPARAAADFAAAGIWAGIAGGAALVGRGIAGTTFSQPAAAAGASTRGGSGTGATDKSGTQVINTGRAVVVEHIVTIQAEKGFIAKEVVKSLDQNHPELHDRVRRASR